jgi:hypothetical protein
MASASSKSISLLLVIHYFNYNSIILIINGALDNYQSLIHLILFEFTDRSGQLSDDDFSRRGSAICRRDCDWQPPI